MPAPRPSGQGLSERRVLVPREKVAWLRYVLEGHDGLALMHGDGSGVVLLLAPHSQADALDELIAHLFEDGTIRAVLGR